MADAPRIRRATRADRSLLLHFHRALYIGHRTAVVPPELDAFVAYRDMDAALRDDVDALLSGPHTMALVAELTEAPAGYVTGHVETDDRRVLARKGVVEDWYVEPDARGAGVGRALLEALERAFRDRGCEVIESETWVGNDGARAAHRALGFLENQVKMRKRL